MKKVLFVVFCVLALCLSVFGQGSKPEEKSVKISVEKVKAALELPETRVEKARLQLEIAQRDANDAQLTLLEEHGITRAELAFWERQIAPDGSWLLKRKTEQKK